MQHSVIIKIGENLVYQQAPTPKPIPESTSSPVEYNRALPEWEHTAKNYLVKKADESQFAKYIDNNPEMITTGIKIPFEDVELYEDGTGYPKRKYARYGVGKQQTEVSPQKETLQEALNEKYCEFSRDAKGVLSLKCKNVSFEEMQTAKDDFLEKEKRENAQPKDDAKELVEAVSQHCSYEKQANAKEVVLICIKKILDNGLATEKGKEYLQKVMQETKNL